jgi:cation diffusion facilitator family transporter
MAETSGAARPHRLTHDDGAAHADGRHGGHGHSHVPGNNLAGSTHEGLRVVAIATAGMLVVAVVEFGFFAFSQSAGLLSDALHNLGDVFTTVAIWAAFLVARRPATQRYTYGYHRIEDLAGAFIALVIVITASLAAWESYIRLVSNAVPTQIGWAVGAALFGFLGNEALAQYKIREGGRLNSQPLVADGKHSRADGITSLAAAAGLVLEHVGVRHADPVAGLLISVAILYILVDVGRDVFRRLMDAVDPRLIEQVRDLARHVPGVMEVADVRARWGGRRLYIAFNIGADSNLTLAQAHAIAEHARQEVLSHVAGAAIVDIHVDPVGLPAGEDPHAWQHTADGEEDAGHAHAADGHPPDEHARIDDERARP